MREYPQRSDQMPTLAPVIVVSTVQSPSVISQPTRGHGVGRAGNSAGHGKGASNRGVTHTEARQPAVVYAAQRLEEKDDVNIIAGMF